MKSVISLLILFLGTMLLGDRALAGPSCTYERIEDTEVSKVFCHVKPSGNRVRLPDTNASEQKLKKLKVRVDTTYVSYDGKSYAVPCKVATVNLASRPWIFEKWQRCFAKNANVGGDIDFTNESLWKAEGVSFDEDVEIDGYTVPSVALGGDVEGLNCSWGSYGPASNFETEKGRFCGGEQLATGEVECTDPKTNLRFQTVVACPQASSGDPTACFKAALNEKNTKDVKSEEGQK